MNQTNSGNNFKLFFSLREEIPSHIQQKATQLAKEKLQDIRNHKMYVVYAVTGNIIEDEKTKKILGIGEELTGNDDLNEIYVGPRGGLTSAWSTQVSGILKMAQVKGEGKVEKIIYHTYETDIENPEQKLGTIWYDQMTQIAVSKYADVAKMFEVGEKGKLEIVDIIQNGKEYLDKYQKENGLNMYPHYVDYLYDLFKNKYRRNPTDAELFAFAYANSEHCNHDVFKGHHIIDGKRKDNTLFDYIKATYKNNPGKTKVAYVDDAAGFDGEKGLTKFTSADGKINFTFDKINNTLKVETHNHPTRIYALEGMATGIGGLLRDLSAIGRGGTPNATMNMIIVSDLVKSFARTSEGKESALDIVAEGSIGAANYNNEFGVPSIQGGFKVFEAKVDGVYFGNDKPQAIVGGKGNVFEENLKSKEVPVGALVVYVGGDNYPIGMGGGAASSGVSKQDTSNLDFNSVQRGNAIMQSKIKNFIDELTEQKEENSILKIGDVGASGWTNTLQEILEDIGKGAKVDFSKLPIGDKSMGPKEVLSNESQERYMILIKPEDLQKVKKIADRNNTPIYVIGEITEGTQYTVYNPETNEKYIDMDIIDMLGHSEELVLKDETVKLDGGELNFEKMDLETSIEKVISHPTVGNKDFLVTIGDRSVGGKVVQDQMVGPWQTALSNVGVTLHGLDKTKLGEIITSAERGPLSIISPKASVNMGISTAVLKALTAYIPDLDSFAGSGNWMFDKGTKGQLASAYEAAETIESLLKVLKFDIPVGKDSNSMRDGKVVSPLTFAVTLYADCGDVNKILTPDFKKVKNSELLLIDFGEGKNRLGASILAQVNNQFGNEVPDLENPQNIRNFMEAMIELHEKNLLLAYHKRSDGGLFSAIAEMSFASHIGADIELQSIMKDNSHEQKLRALFSEELGVIFQVESSKKDEVIDVLKKYNLDHLVHTIGKPNFDKQNITFSYNGEKFVDKKRVDLQKLWSGTSLKVKTHRKNNNPKTTKAEFDRINDEFEPPMKEVLTFDIKKHKAWDVIKDYKENNKPKPKVAVLRTEGSNSQDEISRFYNRVGFEVYDVHLNDLIAGKHKLDDFVVVDIVGGFSHGDALGAGVGMSQIILNNSKLREGFENYKGIIRGSCNGYQTICELADELKVWGKWPKLKINESNSFEARKGLVKIIEATNSVFLKGMDGSIIEAISSHGEGRQIGGDDNFGVKYCDHYGNPTEKYPYNPNGSKNGNTSFEFVGDNVKVFGLMPHPERDFREDSPWMQMVLNIRLEVENMKNKGIINF